MLLGKFRIEETKEIMTVGVLTHAAACWEMTADPDENLPKPGGVYDLGAYNADAHSKNEQRAIFARCIRVETAGAV